MKKLIISLLLGFTFPVLAQQAFKWPQDKQAVIVLTYDDALASQLNRAIPQLNKHKLTGTFFLDGRLSPAEMLQWRTAGKKGHELANHTLYHPCSQQTLKAAPRFTSENYDVPSILKEIGMMNKILFGIDGKENRTYAFPCSESLVGGVDYTGALQQSKLVQYAHSGGDKNSVIVNFQGLNPYQVPSWAVVDNPDGTRLIDFVKEVEEKGGLGVLMFHGIGGDYIQVSAEAHERLLQYLASHKKEIWVATFQEVMNYLTAHTQ